MADLASFRGIHLNHAMSAARFTHAVHATRTVRILDFDGWVFPLKNQYDFDNGVTDIAWLSSALYKGSHILGFDKLKKHDDKDKPLDKGEPGGPVEQVIDLSGFPHGDIRP